jgi:hypothetical protein
MPAIASLEELKVAQRCFRSMFLAASPNTLRLTLYDKDLPYALYAMRWVLGLGRIE